MKHFECFNPFPELRSFPYRLVREKIKSGALTEEDLIQYSISALVENNDLTLQAVALVLKSDTCLIMNRSQVVLERALRTWLNS